MQWEHTTLSLGISKILTKNMLIFFRGASDFWNSSLSLEKVLNSFAQSLVWCITE